MAFAWDARAYDALPLPHVGWAQGVIERLDPGGAASVLDAGCGTGRDLATVLDRNPGLMGYGVDRDQQMLAAASARLARFGERVALYAADLTRPLPVPAVDAVMSVAVFHWVDDDAGLFGALAGALRPGGRLVFDCGGAGNIARVTAALHACGAGPTPDPTVFRDEDRCRAALQAAGFAVQDVRLRPDPLVLPDRETLLAFLAAVTARPYLAGRTPDGRRALLEAVADRLGDLTIDYVRLEAEALRMR